MFNQDEAKAIVRLAGDDNTTGILANYIHDSSFTYSSLSLLKCCRCGLSLMAIHHATTLAEQVATALIHEQELHS